MVGSHGAGRVGIGELRGAATTGASNKEGASSLGFSRLASTPTVIHGAAPDVSLPKPQDSEPEGWEDALHSCAELVTHD